MSRSDESSGTTRAIADLAIELRSLAARIDSLDGRIERRQAETSERLDTVLAALEHVHDDDRDARRRLRELRARQDYESAFTAPEPLVSVVIPTYDSVQTLIERAIPSALEQTHPAIEVVVVGDHAAPATAAELDALGDPRVRFHNLTVRGPYLEHGYNAWLAAGTPAFNAGAALAEGAWIAPLGDDDAFDRGHVERLLTRARADRLEYVYGQIRQILPDGSESLLAGFPPRFAATGLQAALYHAGLRFMELEFAHAAFGTPNDWGLIRRMMRAGVRMGAVDEISVTYWPSLRGTGPPPKEEIADAAAAGESARAVALEATLNAERRRAVDLEARAADLHRHLAVLEGSRSWRITAPLRRLRRRGRR